MHSNCIAYMNDGIAYSVAYHDIVLRAAVVPVLEHDDGVLGAVQGGTEHLMSTNTNETHEK